jgi:hypothetical protein
MIFSVQSGSPACFRTPPPIRWCVMYQIPDKPDEGSPGVKDAGGEMR